METPKISVIVPVYNTRPYLEQCLDSILTQTLTDIEIICVNDGSQDDSQSILERYIAADPRVRVMKKENGGLSSARNAGMGLARGDYIAFVDSDDFIAPNMMEALYTRAEETGADITIGDLFLYDHRSGKVKVYRDQALFARLGRKVFALEEEPALIGCIGAWDRIYRRSFLQEIGARFPEGMIYEDALFTAETLVRAKRIALVPEKLYYYRKNVPGSITGTESESEKYRRDFLAIQAGIRGILEDACVSKEVLCEYAVYFVSSAFVHQLNVSDIRSFRAFFSAVRAMMRETDYQALKVCGAAKHRRYVRYLRKNQLCRCRYYFSLRRAARRGKLWIKTRKNKINNAAKGVHNGKT